MCILYVCFQASTDSKPPLPDPTFNRRCSLIVSEVNSFTVSSADTVTPDLFGLVTTNSLTGIFPDKQHNQLYEKIKYVASC